MDGRGGPGGLAPPAGGYRGPGPLVLHSTKACALFVVLFVGVFVPPEARSMLSVAHKFRHVPECNSASLQKSVLAGLPHASEHARAAEQTRRSLHTPRRVDATHRTRTAGSHTDPVESVRRRRTRTTCRLALHPLTDPVESMRGRRTHATQLDCPGVEPKQ